MNYHHKKTIIQTCKTARYSLIGLLSLLVVTSGYRCTNPNNRHKTVTEKGSTSTTSCHHPCNLQAKDIAELQNKFGFLADADGQLVTLEVYQKAVKEAVSQINKSTLNVKEFERLAKTHQPMGYAKQVLEEFITKPVKILKNKILKSDCDKSPRVYVWYMYIDCANKIHGILAGDDSGADKIQNIQQTIENFKTHTDKVRTTGIKLETQKDDDENIIGVDFVESEDAKHKLSATFITKLDNVVTHLESCLEENKTLIEQGKQAEGEEGDASENQN